MTGQDAELEQLRHEITCAALLETLAPTWRLDRRGSTRRALKYRRGAGEVLIVNHDGRGWWDPMSSAKGDVFDLVQFLDPGLNFGGVRKVLRHLVGVTPRFTQTPRQERAGVPGRPPAERWLARPRLRRGSPSWAYLTGERLLPASVLRLAEAADIVREGPHGSAWFAHRDEAGFVTHVEIRGPDFRGSLRGGSKALFRLAIGTRPPRRLALAEAPIDALSLAALEACRADTVYAATGGGMGEGTERAIAHWLVVIGREPDAVLVSATDANDAGDRFAARHAELADAARVAFERLRPTIGADWNDTLRTRARTDHAQGNQPRQQETAP